MEIKKEVSHCQQFKANHDTIRTGYLWGKLYGATIALAHAKVKVMGLEVVVWVIGIDESFIQLPVNHELPAYFEALGHEGLSLVEEHLWALT